MDLPGPFSAPYLPIFALSSSVYSSYFSWLKKAMSQYHIQGDAQKARKECTNKFWGFASQVLDENNAMKHVDTHTLPLAQ